MRSRLGLTWQITLVGALFLGSLGVLLSTNVATLGLSQREVEIRDELGTASRKMAEAASPLLDELKVSGIASATPEDWNRRLTQITRTSLAGQPGVEGGFFLAANRNEFAGYAFPTDPNAMPEPRAEEPVNKEKKGKKGKKGGGNSRASSKPRAPEPARREPPPREHAFILAQCRNSLNLEPDAAPIAQVLDVGPSRVLIVTEPVGTDRPAEMATWLMVRLTSPEQQAADLNRFKIATGLALAGVFLSLVLSVNLGRSLQDERRQREQLREELRRSERLAALGKLLAGVAHEVRNPLAAIRSTVELWKRLPERARDPAAVEPILNAVDRLNALVGRLLFFVRTAHDERRPVDLNAIVKEAIALLRAQAEGQGVLIQTELAASLPQVAGSPQALQQVVLNLATNALQAMPQGGKLLWRTAICDNPPGVMLSIADTGPGVGPADEAHLFEPFHTTRPEGTGLGLALCREIVLQHGGRIELDRQPGWGAIFRVTLPLRDNP